MSEWSLIEVFLFSMELKCDAKTSVIKPVDFL